MTDYKEEQNNEVEALESIYPEEFQLISDSPLHKFTILVKSNTYQGNEDSTEQEPGACFTLQFEYTPKYPDEPPLMELLDFQNIEEEECLPLRTLLEEQFSECAGMAMVFTLVSAAQEWINTFIENRLKKEEEEAERLLREEEERERVSDTAVAVDETLFENLDDLELDDDDEDDDPDYKP
ncbi:RWD domain-containing protein 1 [Hyalella azteca]|uniref:RWD domain-containing protein 1 n=1 Tax=Hyalella azteca TaxID=294128 RepID=A0A8B7NDF3_HYAAZ|nr:RWD domain-containing protein 1 [Hyalella azteca]